MTNKEIAKILKSTAAMIDLTGGNPYRSRAMANAARNLERAEESVLALAESDQLTSIRGVGDGLAEQIKELVSTGTFKTREDLLGAIPAGLMEILRIKGLGAKKVRVLWQKLGITTTPALEHAAASGQLATIDGFGQKTQENILQNIQFLKQYITRRRYADLFQLVEPAITAIQNLDGVFHAQMTGELRRKLETVGEAEIVVATDDAEPVVDALAAWLDAPPAFDDASRCIEGKIADGIPFKAYIVPEADFVHFQWERTGNPEHVASFIQAFGAPAGAATEQEIYEHAGLAFILPELREDAGELDAAKSNKLPNLIIVDDLQGTLHNHSKYSDGAHTLQQMADAAFNMGLSYFGICDHSQSLVVANGLPPKRVAQQQEEIRSINEAYAAKADRRFKVFSGIESDILNDGALDYADDVLASFDFIVASVHTRLNMPEEEATQRVLRAIENPYTSLLGHPTGRILLVREGYPLDYDRILDACAEHNVAIELNASPYRLDLDWRYIRKATDKGILISINPDAHAIEGLKDMRWGTEVARKGWLTAEQCLNALSLEAFQSWLDTQRSKRPA